jgi:hypothetical protein
VVDELFPDLVYHEEVCLNELQDVPVRYSAGRPDLIVLPDPLFNIPDSFALVVRDIVPSLENSSPVIIPRDVR